MVSSWHFLTFCLLMALPCWGALIAREHGQRGWIGAGMGALVFVAMISGRLIWLMLLDFSDRKGYPHRRDPGLGVKASTVVIFVVSVLASIALYLRMSG